MSFNEALALAMLDHDAETVAIYEQYALLPVGLTTAIARELRVKYPVYPGCHASRIVMTTDFVVDRRDGTRKAYSVKPKEKLLQPRVRELLTVEAGYWRLAGVELVHLTDEYLRCSRYENLLGLQQAAVLSSYLVTVESRWLQAFREALTPSAPVSQCIRQAAERLGLHYREGTELFFHGLWRGAIHADLDQPLRLEQSVSELEVRVLVC
jgi:hypothetical protein